MNYKLIKSNDVSNIEKFGIDLKVYPSIDNAGIVLINTEFGHNQEFYEMESTFTYIILEGEGIFSLNNKSVMVSKGDFLSIFPNTRIYYKGKMKMVLISTPAWTSKQEVETKQKIW